VVSDFLFYFILYYCATEYFVCFVIAVAELLDNAVDEVIE